MVTDKAVQEVAAACREWGFFQIINQVVVNFDVRASEEISLVQVL